MVNKILLRDMNIKMDEVDKEVQEAMATKSSEELKNVYDESMKNFEVGAILKGKIVSVRGSDVVVDVGYKSEGIVSIEEFEKPSEIKPGDEIEVLLEAVEDDSGLIVLSKRKADRVRGWERLIATHKEGDTVTGRVTRKIKGGLLVDIGVPVFLPASQIDIRRPGEIAEWIGKEVTCKILKIDKERRNMVVSRRRLIEEERAEKKKKLLAEIQPGEIRKGVVKNIADFGVFVDLGGIDGLLHITDMSWGRISHPSEMVAIDDEIEVIVLSVDREKEKIALGLKQKTESPWAHVEEKYPVGTRVKGQVVNIMPYGAFVKLEDGIEGLVHISEMSWTRRINHPSEVVAIGDTVEVVVLSVNKEKQEISLGMKQIEANPWAQVQEKYPPGTRVKGRVRTLTNYGAFVELEEGIDGLLHVSDISWTKKITHPSEILKKGDKIEVVVLSVDPEKKRVALGMKQLADDPWSKDIPSRYLVGDVVKGKVTKSTPFGVFVELEPGLEGLLHVSEISDKKISSPEELIKVGDEVAVRIVKVDTEERKIGLSMKPVKGAPDVQLGVIKPAQASEIPPTEKSATTTETTVQEAQKPPESKPTPTKPASDTSSRDPAATT